jgi:hypothetical protein
MTALLVAALLSVPPVGRDRPKGSAPSQPTPQAHLTDEEVRAKVDAWLGAIDRPITAEQWKSLGPRAAAVLEPVVTDPDAFPTSRAIAMDGLAAVAPNRAAALAPGLARDERQPVVLRVAAVHATGAVLSAPAAQRELKPVLRGRDPGLRGEAAEVLSRRGGCAAVREEALQDQAQAAGSWQRAIARCRP